MKEIKVINFKGTDYAGQWNGKIYQSKIDGREDLHRIYIDNNPIYITQEELNKITSDIDTIKEQQRKEESLNTLKKAKELLYKMTDKDKMELAETIIYYDLQEKIQAIDSREFKRLHEILCKLHEEF